MSNIFTWKEYGDCIISGGHVEDSDRPRTKVKVDNRTNRKRDWKAEYQKRLKAGTAGKLNRK